jgi:hypothetical protein
LAGRLGKLLHISEEEAGHCVAGVIGVEGEVTRLAIEIVDVDLGDFAVIAEGDAVRAKLKMKIIRQRVVGAAKEGLRIAADAEVAGRCDGIDLFVCGLPDIDAEVGYIDTSWERAAGVVIQLIAEDEVIQHVAVECVRLRDHGVVVVVLRQIGVGQQIAEVQDALKRIHVGEVASCEFVL